MVSRRRHHRLRQLQFNNVGAEMKETATAQEFLVQIGPCLGRRRQGVVMARHRRYLELGTRWMFAHPG